MRDRGLGVLFVSVFLVSWIGQHVFEWLDHVNEATAHGERAAFWSSAFWVGKHQRRR